MMVTLNYFFLLAEDFPIIDPINLPTYVHFSQTWDPRRCKIWETCMKKWYTIIMILMTLMNLHTVSKEFLQKFKTFSTHFEWPCGQSSARWPRKWPHRGQTVALWEGKHCLVSDIIIDTAVAQEEVFTFWGLVFVRIIMIYPQTFEASFTHKQFLPYSLQLTNVHGQDDWFFLNKKMDSKQVNYFLYLFHHLLLSIIFVARPIQLSIDLPIGIENWH